METFKKTIGILLITFFSFSIVPENSNFGDDQTNTKVEVLHEEIKSAFNEAEAKFLKTDVPDEVIDGPHPDVSKCACKGTGVITHGDGHTTPCPYHAKTEVFESEVKPVIERKDRPKNSASKSHYKILIFTAEWCNPCVQMSQEIKKSLKDTDIEISNLSTADIKFIDVDKPENKTFYQQVRGTNNLIPLVVEIENNVVKDVRSGYQSIDDFLKRYDLEK